MEGEVEGNKGVEGEDGVERLACLVRRVERGTRRYRERGVWAISNSEDWGVWI